MDRDTLQIICIILIMIIIFGIWYWFNKEDDDKRRKHSSKLYNDSIGGYDDNAKDALKTIKSIEKPVAQDLFLAGNILAYNVLQGNLRNGRENIDVVDEILNDYRQVLQFAVNREYNNDRENIPMTFMIDHITDFTINNIEELQNDRLWGNVVGGLHIIMDELPSARAMTIDDKKERAAENANNKEEFMKNYYEESVIHPNDPQNTHDSSVVMALNKTNKELNKTKIDKESDISKDIIKYMDNNKNKIDDIKYQKILKVLDEMNHNIYVLAYNDTDTNILRKTWNRTNISENNDNADNMKFAILDELANCYDGDHVVCPNGRAAHVLGALVLQDFDKELGKTQTLAEYKNEVYRECNKIIHNEIELAKKSDDPGLKSAAESYNNIEIEVSPKDEAKLRRILKSKIDELINTYSDKISDNNLEALRIDCYAAIDI